MTSAVPILAARGLTKTYGRLAALDKADLDLFGGEVHALIGANGAGKSTLIKILTGAIAPTAGSVTLNGEPISLGNPQRMIRHGIGCVYQHSNIAPAMTVLDNIFMGRQPTRGPGLVDRHRLRAEGEALLARFGLMLDLDAQVGTLPTVKQKEVEIAKALSQDARVLLMDEPTGWLAASDVERLHDTIRKLRNQGVAIVYISHMLDEIFAVCDSMTILRDGRIVARSAVAEVTRHDVVTLMVGDKLADAARSQSERRPARGAARASVMSLCGLGREGVFADVSFDLHAGEVLCITGLVGSRRSELVHAIFGDGPADSGRIEIAGKPVKFSGPAEAMAHGVGLVPEDRHQLGLMLGMSVRENLVLGQLERFHRFGVLARKAIARAAAAAVAALNIQPPRPAALVRQLSGGNQQKVLIGKWLQRAPRILILDEPTVGVDVGAKAEIYALLRAECSKGAAVLVVSSDLEEVMTIADRIGVMVSGRLSAIHDAAEITTERLVAEIGAGT